MGFTDKFMEFFKLGGDYEEEYYDDYDEDEDYSDYDDYNEVSDEKKSKFLGGFKKNDADVYDEKKSAKNIEKETSKSQKGFGKSSNKVVPMRTGRGNMEVCVIKPSNVEEAREISDTLLSGRAVVLNLEGLHVDIAQRIIDFASGSCYSINGNLQKISSYIFIITPESVDISGDFQDFISGGFDVAGFKQQ